MAVFTGDGADNILNAGNGTINGFTGGSLLELQDGIGDTINGLAGHDQILAGSGDDTIYSNGGRDIIDGGAGLDLLIYDRRHFSSSIIFQLTDTLVQTTFAGQGTAVTRMELFDIRTGSGDDFISLTHSNGGNDRVQTGAGNDTVDGGNGNDELIGDAGDDTLVGGAGMDRLVGGNDNDTLDGGAGNDELVGGAGDDTLIGGGGDDTIKGGSGIDTVSYENAASAVSVRLDISVATGGAGNDTLSGIENVIGSAHNDLIDGDSQNNVLTGGDGNDQLTDNGYGDADSDTLIGGKGRDYIGSSGGGDTIRGGSGKDFLNITFDSSVTFLQYTHTPSGTTFIGEGTFVAGIEQYRISAGSYANGGNFSFILGGGDDDVNVRGNATIDTGGGQDSLGLSGDGAYDVDAGAGDDEIRLGSFGPNDAADTIDGGAGHDIMVYTPDDDSADGPPAGITFNMVDLATPTEIIGVGTTVVNVEQFEFWLGPNNNTLTLLDGDDVVHSGGGVDVLDGGGGNDKLYFFSQANGITFTPVSSTVWTEVVGDGSWIVNFETFSIGLTSGNDNIALPDGDDTITMKGEGHDTLDGGGGTDTLQFLDYFTPNDIVFEMSSVVTPTIFGGTGSSVINIEKFWFETGSGNDIIKVLDGNDYLNTREGDDILSSGAGDDSVYGGDGNDFINGGAGADRLYGGNDIDTLSYEDSDAGVSVNLQYNTASGGHAEGDTIAEFENLIGSIYADMLTGDTGANDLDGLQGGDTLAGGDGDDVLRGRGGNDDLIGGAGVDVMTGGSGSEHFIFTGIGDSGAGAAAVRDRITDFEQGADVIDLGLIDANPLNGPGEDAFTFIAGEGSAFTNAAGQVVYYFEGGSTIIALDVTGNGSANMEIALDGHINLTIDDFVL